MGKDRMYAYAVLHSTIAICGRRAEEIVKVVRIKQAEYALTRVAQAVIGGNNLLAGVASFGGSLELDWRSTEV
jgi:hypothetical protein